MLYTNLKLLKEQSACSSGLARLIASLPPNYPEDKSISLAHILESNGLEHALWALRATTKDSRITAARMAIEFARHSLINFEKQFPEDNRPRTALEVAADFPHGGAVASGVDLVTNEGIDFHLPFGRYIVALGAGVDRSPQDLIAKQAVLERGHAPQGCGRGDRSLSSRFARGGAGGRGLLR